MRWTRCIWGLGLFFCALANHRLCFSQTAELRVIGQSTLQAQLSSLSDGRSQVTGRLMDESGAPLAGSLRVLSETGQPLELLPCPHDVHGAQQANAEEMASRVPESGQFCARMARNHREVTIVAKSPHFMESRELLHNDGAPRLPRPRFSQAPQTIELSTALPAIAEVFAGGGPGSKIAGAQLSLSLLCQSERLVVEERPLVSNELERFEFELPKSTIPGNCQLEARASAPGHEARSDRRNVLVRSHVELTLLSVQHADDQSRLTLSAQTTGGLPVNEGIVEVTATGAHLSSAPLDEGRAVVEVERTAALQLLEASYLPAGPAYVPLSSVELEIPPRQVGFRWMTLHTLGLSAFCAWIAYAWLKPRRKSSARSAPPNKPLVQSSERSSGPIEGAVYDAHTGAAIAGARLALVTVGVRELTESEVTHSDERGRFAFQTKASRSHHVRIVASAPGYMTLRAPAEGNQLTVHMGELRREAVRQLIEWARRQGRRFRSQGSPTPLEVEDLARSQGNRREQAWAAQVGRLAYHHHPPTEEEVRSAASPEGFDQIQ